MNRSVLKQLNICLQSQKLFVLRSISVSTNSSNKDHYRVLVVGGGTGGLATASKFARKLGAGNVAIVEPSKHHYYQPGWTLAGGGLKKPEDLCKDEEKLIPKGCDWIRKSVEGFDPENNAVILGDNKTVKYDYLIVAVGIETNFNAIKGLKEALDNDDRVVSNYSPVYVRKTFPAIQKFKEGNAIFTFPNGVIKCPGAPQKIMYMADDTFRKNGVRDKATVMFNTALPVIFGVKKYAASLMEVVKEKNIQLNTRTVLTEVNHKAGEAVFEKMDTPGTFVTYKYSLLHVGPPMKPFDFVKQSKVADANGYVDVQKETLQHKKYPNIFGIGDCTNLPTSKTAAAIAAQCGILFTNMSQVMNNKSPSKFYDGYTSCPLITGYGKTILAEFDFNGNPLETFPINQGKQRWTSYVLKKDVMPELYWYGLIKGFWNGPSIYRKIMHLNPSK